jgi:TonB family protein
MSTLKSIRLAVISAASVVAMFGGSGVLAAPHAPSVAPLEVPAAPAGVTPHVATKPAATCHKRKAFARVAAAAICTEDLETITFREYSVDWSDWLKQVADSWSQAMAEQRGTGLKPSGPMFIEFTCKRNGTVSDVVIDRSSGDRMLDAIQVGTLLRCTPLPAFPAQSVKKDVTLLCIWSYNKTVNIVKAKAPKQNDKQVVRVSISGAAM